MQHVMALVEDTPGILRRIIGLYSSRGYLVRNVSVGPTLEAGKLRVNLVLDEPAERAQRFARQLRRLIDVLSVDVADDRGTVARELVLVKVAAGPGHRPEVLQVAEIFRGRVVDAAPESVVLELTGATEKIDAFIQVLQEFGVTEIARTGAVTLRRGPVALRGDRAEGPGALTMDLAATASDDRAAEKAMD